MTSPELIQRFLSYSGNQSWVTRLCFISDRGWRRVDGGWENPHDGTIESDSIIPMAIEMALKEGR